MGSAQKQGKYQKLGAAPTSDISVNPPPPPMNSSAPITRKMGGFNENMAAVIISDWRNQAIPHPNRNRAAQPDYLRVGDLSPVNERRFGIYSFAATLCVLS
jgi:hypothetical protein